MVTTDEVVIAIPSRKDLKVIVEDPETGAPVNVAGGAFQLQATSDDVVATIDEAGVVTDGPAGIVTWSGIGAYVTTAELGARSQATFAARWRFTDASGKKDFGPLFYLVYVKPPAV